VPLAASGSRRGRTPAHRALDILARSARLRPGRWLGATAHDPHVVRAGLEGALRAGDAATTLEWAELTRTWAAPLVPGPHEPDTPTLSALAGRYRAALRHGRGPHTLEHARRWESARWRAFRSAGTGPATATRPAWDTATPPPDGPADEVSMATRPSWAKATHPDRITDALLERLGDDRAFVRYTWAGRDAVALVAVAGRVHARGLGPLPRLTRALARFTHPAHAPSTRACPVAARDAAAEVAQVLLAPVLPLVGDRSLVVAGDPCLGDPPWGMLPALCGRPVSLVPTARFWSDRADPPNPSPGQVLLVAAPEPRGARHEVAALADVYPDARVLSGDRARLGGVLEGFADADLVHLAGHGHVPDRVPMLASVDLWDGPLLARDLTGLTAAPAVVTLSTCWNGRGFNGATGLPSGFVGALQARGARTVVASPLPVRDTDTSEAMVRFHRALAAGVPAPEAVALHLGQAGFCCFGV
jgi:hypothetical protein